MAQVNYLDNGLVFIKKESGTAVSSISVDNCFSSKYTQYKIVQNVTHSSTSALNFRLRASGSDNASADYNYQFLQAVSGTVNKARSTVSTSWFVGYSATGESTISNVEILNPFQTVNTICTVLYAQDMTSNATITFWTFSTDVTTSYDGFTIYPGAGTITGDVYVYGYKKS